VAGVAPVIADDRPVERLASLFDAYYDRLYRLARRLAPSPNDALDLVQETFLKAARSARSIPRGPANEEAWLVRVLINIRRDQWRKMSVRDRLNTAASTATKHPEPALVARATVWQALNILAPRRRAIFVMCELEGIAIPEIATLLGISAITVRWHLSMGRRALKQFLSGDQGEPVQEIRDLLRDADPLRHEQMYDPRDRELCRQAVLAAAFISPEPEKVKSPSRIAFFAAVALLLLALLGLRGWPPFYGELQAAVRFEVRLAEDTPSAGLREAKMSGSGRSVYLHRVPIVTNADIAAADIVQSDTPAQYGVEVKFNAAGTEKMREATSGHIGRPLAIIIDGRVVIAPVLRTPIDASAIVSGNFTKAQAARIANGIRSR